jgi:hypothetical protein
MSLPIPTSANAQYYLDGRGLALFEAQKPLAVDPPMGTPTWWTNEGIKDVWAGIPSRIGTEPAWLDSGGAPRKVIGGPGAAPNPWNPQPAPTNQTPPPYVKGVPVPYTPRPGQTGQGVYVPPPGQPPGGGVSITYEVYGRIQGRQVPLWKELRFDGVSFHLQQGGRILISHSPSEGYGLGGVPGSWATLYGNRSPADWGLDPDKGVLAFDGTRGFAVPASQLVEIFGAGWRQVVYA